MFILVHRRSCFKRNGRRVSGLALEINVLAQTVGIARNALAGHLMKLRVQLNPQILAPDTSGGDQCLA